MLEVAALPLLVASIDDVLATKLLAMSEQEPDYRPVLEIARSLREQIDWDFVRTQVDDTPFGAAFFTLVERLRILPEPVAVPSAARCGREAARGRKSPSEKEVAGMPTWAWILIIVLLVLLVTGGVGYRRR